MCARCHSWSDTQKMVGTESWHQSWRCSRASWTSGLLEVGAATRLPGFSDFSSVPKLGAVAEGPTSYSWTGSTNWLWRLSFWGGPIYSSACQQGYTTLHRSDEAMLLLWWNWMTIKRRTLSWSQLANFGLTCLEICKVACTPQAENGRLPRMLQGQRRSATPAVRNAASKSDPLCRAYHRHGHTAITINKLAQLAPDELVKMTRPHLEARWWSRC